MKTNNVKFTTLDGNIQEQLKISEDFIDLLTAEECERAMSSEFDYLDKDE